MQNVYSGQCMNRTEQDAARPADAIARSWVDFAPDAIQPYLRLMRLDRPIGTWLLFWPCVFGLAVGTANQPRPFGEAGDLWLLILFAIGSVVMRGAGCTYNDIVDRDIDARVERTRGRPIPSGAVSMGRAWLFLAAQCAIGLVVLLQLNRFSILLGAASLILVAIYPFMKRLTWWPQAWLGLTFNWGALLGFAAETGHLGPRAWLLYAGCFFWTLGYDTIYALQDVEDDALIGVKSTARLFGIWSPLWVASFYAAAFVLIAASAFVSRHWLAVLVLLPAGVHLFWQAWKLDVDDTALCLRLFRANRESGLLMALALVFLTWRF